MHPLLASLSPEHKKLIKKIKMPTFIDPMLAKLTHDPFSDPDWIYERKFDGMRCLTFKSNSHVVLKSRNNHVINDTYPEIAAAFKAQDRESSIIDGEIVAFAGKETSFSKLQARLGIDDPERARATNIAVYYYVFDIMYFAGYDITQLPLLERKKILQQALIYTTRVRYTTHRVNDGLRYFKEARQKGWEGLIAKHLGSIYEVGERSGSWLKFKCVNEQEFVIGGYTAPQHSRIGFGALLLGFYKNKKLMYAGKVGTGFDAEMLKTLKEKMEALQSKKSPFANYEEDVAGVYWIKPHLVCEIGFTEWTRDNKLRHPRFLGLRYDKAAHEVVQEI